MIEQDERPWGRYETFAKNEKATVKILTILSGEETSLQFHHHREECWFILSGNPVITVGDMTVEAKEGAEFLIPQGAKHRINGGKTGTKILEVMRGGYDELDIVRVEDKYCR